MNDMDTNAENQSQIDEQTILLKLSSDYELFHNTYYIPYLKDIDRFIKDYNNTLIKLNFSMVLHHIEYPVNLVKLTQSLMRLILVCPTELMLSQYDRKYKTDKYANKFINHSLEDLLIVHYYHSATVLHMLKDKYTFEVVELFYTHYKTQIQFTKLDSFLDKLLKYEYGIGESEFLR